jgi:hypothetical protein
MPMPKSGRVILRRASHPPSNHLVASAQDEVDEDVLGAGDVPHQPRQRVEVLARPRPHLIVGEPAEGPLGQGALVAGEGGRVHAAVLVEEKIACVHGKPPLAQVREVGAGSSVTGK